MPHVARRRMTAAGRRYAAGAEVPLADLPLDLQRQLIDQRKVVFEESAPEDVTETEPQAKKKARAKPRS